MSSIALASLSTALLVVAAQAAILTSAKDLAPQMVPLQKYGGDPHGPDPHGDDPSDEQHDPGLPANQDRSKGKAPKDVYGGQYPNDQAPY